MKTWIPLNDGIGASYPFQADDEYIVEYNSRIVDPEHITTPEWYTETTAFIDITDVDPLPTIGWVLTKTGWEAPPPPVLSPGEIAAQAVQDAELAQTEKDNAFIRASLEAVRSGKALSQNDRDRLMILQLSRTVV